MLILMGIFIFYPLVNSFIVSIYKNYRPLANSGAGTIQGYTLANFKFIFGNQLFGYAIRNTFVIAFVSVPLSIIVALLISVGLKQITKFRGFFQTVFFLPYVTNAIAIGMAFAFLFHTDYGLINDFLKWFGIDPPIKWISADAPWLNKMSALLIYTIWGGLAFKILVFTSGLENIDKQYYDAARIDAASRWTIFKRITVPLLSPLILFISITSTIGALKAYNTVIGLFGTNLGTGKSSMVTIVAFVFNYIYEFQDVGAMSRAASAAIILFFITVVFSLLQGWASRNRVHY